MELTTLLSNLTLLKCCLWCQRYKIWMELTTWFLRAFLMSELFMMSKIQNLNGTHNLADYLANLIVVVYDVKDTKFEWNSQLCYANSVFAPSCLWCQRYKIWMELTTIVVRVKGSQMLFMMSKIQNLNGTHNCFSSSLIVSLVVYDVKDTKFEWNSQLPNSFYILQHCCLWCQRYKIWMELTTTIVDVDNGCMLFMMSKIQNLNGTHNHRGRTYSSMIRCLWCQRYKIWMELTTFISYCEYLR